MGFFLFAYDGASGWIRLVGLIFHVAKIHTTPVHQLHITRYVQRIAYKDPIKNYLMFVCFSQWNPNKWYICWKFYRQNIKYCWIFKCFVVIWYCAALHCTALKLVGFSSELTLSENKYQYLLLVDLPDWQFICSFYDSLRRLCDSIRFNSDFKWYMYIHRYLSLYKHTHINFSNEIWIS